MEETQEDFKQEQKDRWITILLIIGNLIIWTIILLFVSIAKVDAATVNPTSNEIHTELIAGGGEQYINIGQNQDYTLAVTRKYDFFVSNFLNIGTGVFEGQATLTFPSDENCTYYRLHPEHIVLSLNDVAVSGTKSITQCVKDGNTVVLGIKYNYTNMTPNATFKIIYRLPGWTLLKAKMYSIIDYTPKDYATNTDIQNQTIEIINNAIQNAQDIINNSIQENILNRNAISSAVDSAASQIINNANNLANKCENYNYQNNIPIGIDNKYLVSNGTETASSNYYISEYIKLNKNENYTLTLTSYPDGNTASYCIYDKNKTRQYCRELVQQSSPYNITNGEYIRISVSKNTTRTTNFSGKYCQSNTDALLEEFDLIYKFTFNHTTPDDTQFNLAHARENEILEMADDVDISVVNIDIDSESSNWVWTTLTSLITTSNIVFGMFISILSIGIIKLVLGR